MEFHIRQLGDLRKVAAAQGKAMARAVYDATKAEGQGLRDALRADVKGAKFKRAGAMAKTIRGQIFPRKPPSGESGRKPAYVVGYKAPYLAGIFETGGTIAARGRALLIPTPLCRRLIKLRPGQSHAEYRRLAGERFGRLAVQRSRRKGEYYLAAFSSAEDGKVKPLYLFRLARSVTVPVKTHGMAIYRRWDAGYAARMEARIEARFAALTANLSA